eukprot:GDKJ01004549.1.p1 GENE.GDKJ01004549.1~~GDKJ01004549.1.p1  ORF type:complete len:1634 (-),score=387.99 GDKJ01004549.1:508-4755(-)
MMNKSSTHKSNLQTLSFNDLDPSTNQQVGGAVPKIVSNMPQVIQAVNANETTFHEFEHVQLHNTASPSAKGVGGLVSSSEDKTQNSPKKNSRGMNSTPNASKVHSSLTGAVQFGELENSADHKSSSKRALALDVTDLLKIMVNQITNVEQMTGLTSNLDINLEQIFKRNRKVPDLRRVSTVVFSTIREVYKGRWLSEHDLAWQWLWSFAVIAKESKWTSEMAERVLQGWRTLEAIVQVQLDEELAHMKVPQDYFVENEDEVDFRFQGADANASLLHKPLLGSVPTGGGVDIKVSVPAEGGLSFAPPLMMSNSPATNAVNSHQQVRDQQIAAAAAAAAGSRNIHAWLYSSPLNVNGPKKKEFSVADVTDSSSSESEEEDENNITLEESVFNSATLVANSSGGGNFSTMNMTGRSMNGFNTNNSNQFANTGGSLYFGQPMLGVNGHFNQQGSSSSFIPNNATTTAGSSRMLGYSSSKNTSPNKKQIQKTSTLKKPVPSVRVRAKIAYKIGVYFYQSIFRRAPSLRRVFVRPAHNYGILFKKIFSMMIKNVYDPAEMWSKEQTLALRHVNFGMRPSDVPLFGKIFLQCLQLLGGSAWTPQFHSAWTVFWEIGSFGLNCVVIAGSHPATRALILGDRQELRTALREASREQRVQWSCVVELRGQVRSPLEWAIKDGKMKMAELLLREALSLRVDPSNTFYYGAATLWEYHDNLIPFLCDTAPQLLPVLLDGLFWTSSQVLDGHRRVVIFGENLWGDPRYASSGNSVFETPMAVLASCTQPIIDELFLHPVLDILTEIKWKLFGCRSFIMDICVYVCLQFAFFVLGFMSISFFPSVLQFVFRVLCWALSLFLSGRIVFRSYHQLKRGEVQAMLPFGIEIDAIRTLNSQPHKHVDPSLLFKLKKEAQELLKDQLNDVHSSSDAAERKKINQETGKGPNSASLPNPGSPANRRFGLNPSAMDKAATEGRGDGATAASYANNRTSSSALVRQVSINNMNNNSINQNSSSTNKQEKKKKSSNNDNSNDYDKQNGERNTNNNNPNKGSNSNENENNPLNMKHKRGNILTRFGNPRDVTSWTQILISLLVTVAMVSEFVRLSDLQTSQHMSLAQKIKEINFLTSKARQIEWNICVALANLGIWHSLISLSLLWDPARKASSVMGELLSSLTFFLTLIIAFAGAFLRSGLLPSFEGFGAVTATLFFLSQGAFEMELPKKAGSEGGGVIYDTFLEVLAPIFQLVGSLMLSTLLMADLTAQCKQVLPVLRGLSNRWLCLQVALEESRLSEETRMTLFDSLPFKFRVVFDEPSNLTGAISLMMSVSRQGLEFAFDRLERFTSDANTGPDAPWPQQSFESDAQVEFESSVEKQLKHLMSSANRVQRLLNQQNANLPAAPKPEDKDGNESMARSSVATMVTGLSIPELALNF